MFFAKFITASAVLAALVGIAISAPEQAARLIGGQKVDTLRQFPHHVYIIPFGSNHRCGGTILTNQWVITSASCVKDSVRLELNFGKKNENNTHADFFSVSVNRDHVFLYPTNYDDIALIKMPLRLVFSETIAPIKISNLPSHALDHRFSVMPGFDDVIFTTTRAPTTTTWSTTFTSTTSKSTTIKTTTKSTTPPPMTTTHSSTWWDSTTVDTTTEYTIEDTTTDEPWETTWDWTNEDSKMEIADPMNRHFEGGHHHDHHPHPEIDDLAYGMFSIVDHHVCKHALGQGRFDEYTQLCVEGWGNNPNAPCCSDFGSGLIVGWPSQSELVGIFSMFSPACTTKLPSVFTYVAKYLPWIESMIHG